MPYLAWSRPQVLPCGTYIVGLEAYSQDDVREASLPIYSGYNVPENRSMFCSVVDVEWYQETSMVLYWSLG